MHVQDIKTIACLGTGTMGHGVAFLAAKAGYEVRFFGRSEQSVQRGLAGVERAAALYEANGLLPKEKIGELKSHITLVTTLEKAVSGADLVLESVAEDLRVKHEVFTEVEKHCPDKAILATDTSGLDLEEIAVVLKKPERFLAIHFFTPPYLMPTVEVCPCRSTLPEICRVGEDWVESIGNVPVPLAKAVPGFLINRIQAACLREALYIVEQGWASAETVDKAIVHCLGRRYSVTGPIESADMGGLDILGALLDSLGPKLSSADKASPVLAEPRSRGQLGLKTGKGIFEWTPARIEARRGARERSLIDFLKRGNEQHKK